jgi:hypothetical protein
MAIPAVALIVLAGTMVFPWIVRAVFLGRGPGNDVGKK